MTRKQSINFLNWKKMYWRLYRINLNPMKTNLHFRPSEFIEMNKFWQRLEDY